MFKPKKAMTLLALAGIALASTAVNSAANTTFSTDDLILGIRQDSTSGSQSPNALLIDLGQASQFTAASTVIAPLDTMKLTAAEREALENTRDALVVGTLDPLLQQKQYARAQQAVQARLAVHPDNVNLQAAMARIQVAQGNAQGVVTGLRASLDKDPSNLAVRLTLIEAESKLQHFATVSDLAEDGMKIYPRNPYLVIQAANAARARGFRSEALDLMVKARALLNQSGETAPVQTN